MSSIRQGTWDCRIYPKTAGNAITHTIYQRGFHKPVQKCEENLILFLMKGETPVNSKEYVGTMPKGSELTLQVTGSMPETLAMTEREYIYYRFTQSELFCDFCFNHIMKEVFLPFIYTPLKTIPEPQYLLSGSIIYLKGDRIYRDLLLLKRKELAFALGYYYSDYDLSSLVHPFSKYINSLQYLVTQNYEKVKTMEELAQLGRYTPSTFRRIFNNVFYEPVYEWMLVRYKEGTLDDLNDPECSTPKICYKYGFELLPHFSGSYRKSFGAPTRDLRRQDIS